MPEIKLSSEELSLMSLFQSMSGATARDCIIDEKQGRLIFVVSRGQMGLAIGKKGVSVKNVERAVKKPVEVVEWSDDLTEMIKNSLDPRYVKEVRTTDRPDGSKGLVIIVEEKHKGAVLGKGGKNAEKVRILARRYFDISNVQITSPL